MQVASKGFPNVSKIAGRKRLADNLPANETPSFDHGKWDKVLQQHVYVAAGTLDDVTGINMVDYDGIANDPNFSGYLKQLEEADPTQLPPAEQLAFWMNAYNALCINIIIQYERKHSVKIQSITNLTNQQDGAVWNQIAGKVAGTDISLNTIEHQKLRTEWEEPLVHACIVCASASCPNLRPEAFVATRLQEQMEDQMRNWLNNPTKGVRQTGDKVEISRIFLWFGDDFGSTRGIPKFLQQFGGLKMKGKFAPRYFTYSWKINRVEKKEQGPNNPVTPASAEFEAEA